MKNTTQRALPFTYAEGYLKGYLEKSLGGPIELTITNNITRMLSVSMRSGRLHVRLHRIFLESDMDIIAEISDFIRKRRRDTPRINTFIREKGPCIAKDSSFKPKVDPVGRHYNLNEILDSVNAEYFDGAIRAGITWGKRAILRRQRRTTLGSYNFNNNTIRINRKLDSLDVPRYFVRYIVYHEMLHVSVGAAESAKRRLVHSRDFRLRERAFKDYERAILWEKENI